MLTVPIELLHISSLRPAVPLPWPTAQAVALARRVGFVDPVTVRPLSQTAPQHYEILTGLKHWLLAQRAQLNTVAVYVRDPIDEEDAQRLVELDVGSDPHNPIAEAQVLQTWVDEGMSIAAAGRAMRLSRTEASHRLRLLQLAPSVQDRVARGNLEPGKARALVGLAERVQIELAQRIDLEQLNTRQVENLARTYKQSGGDPSADAALKPQVPGKDPNIVRLETELGELVGTRVTISYGDGGRGQLVIDFDNLEIFDGVLERLGYFP